MRLFQAALDTPLDSPFSATLSVHGLHFTVYALSTHGSCAATQTYVNGFGAICPKDAAVPKTSITVTAQDIVIYYLLTRNYYETGQPVVVQQVDIHSRWMGPEFPLCSISRYFLLRLSPISVMRPVLVFLSFCAGNLAVLGSGNPISRTPKEYLNERCT